MLFFVERHHPNNARQQLWNALAILFGVFTVVIAFAYGLSLPPFPLDFGGVLIAFGLHTAAALFAGRKANGVYVAITLPIVVTSYLALGLPETVFSLVLGLLFAEALRPALVRWLDLPMYSPMQGLVGVSLTTGIVLTALFAGDMVSYWLGIPLPYSSLSLHDIFAKTVCFLTIFAVYFMLYSAVYFAMLPPFSLSRLLMLARVMLFHNLILLPVAWFAALLYQGIPTLSYAGIVVVLGFGMGLYRISEINNRRLERRIRELAILNSFAQSLSTRLSMNELLETLYQEISRHVPVEFFVVALFDEARNQWSFPIVVQNGVPVTWQPTNQSREMGKYLIETRRPIIVRGDVLEELRKMGIIEHLTPPIPRALMAIPLISANRLIGTLSLESLTDERAYRRNDVSLLMTMAPHAAAAIANAQLYARVTGMANQLQQVNAISGVISGSLELDPILEMVCQSLLRALRADKAAVFLSEDIDHHRRTSRMAHAIGFTDDYRALFEAMPLSSELNDLHEPFTVNDVYIDPRGLGWRTLAQIGGYAAFAFAPLRVGDRLVGQLTAFYERPHQFTEPELRLLDTFANQIAVSIANAQLYRETEQRAEEMAELVQASQALIESFEMNGVGQTTVQRLQKVLDLDQAVLLVWNEDQRELQPLASLTKHWMNYSLIADTLQRVIREQQIITLPETANERRFLEPVELKVALALPLMLRGETSGVMLLGRQEPRPFNARERQFAMALLNQAATALDNARLFRLIDTELEERIRQLSAIETFSRKISATLDEATLMNELVRVVLEVTGADIANIGIETEPGILQFVQRTSSNDQVQNYGTIWQGITGRVMRSGQYVIVQDVQDDPDYITTIPGMHSEICVPIILDGKPIGVLDLESSLYNAFTTSHLSFLTTLAEHAAISMDKALLFADIQRRNQEMRAILNSTRDGMVLVGTRGELLNVNPAAERLLDMDLQGLIGKNAILELARNARRSSEKQRVRYPYQQLIQNLRDLRENPSQVTKRSYPVVVGEGVREIEETGVPVNDDEGTLARLFILRDITEEAELERFKEHLTETVVHDLRAPLGSVITSLYLIEEAAQEGDMVTIPKVTSAALTLSNDLLNLVTSILDVRKMQSGQLPLDRRQASLSLPVEKAIQALHVTAAEHGIRLLDKLPEGLPTLYVDVDKIRRVLVNLLDNAVKFTPDDGEIRVEADYHPGDATVTVSVVDTGKGIPEEYRDRVFELFATVPKEISTPRRRGTGIGLTFCRLTVEAHGGQIWVDSGPEGGAAMRFTLPLTDAHHAAIMPPAVTQTEAGHLP
jgi:two-component system, NtrC family, sensor histidine kinase KinB